MKLIIILLLTITFSAFSQNLTFKADTLFMDNKFYVVSEYDLTYKLNLYDSIFSTPEFTKKINYTIDNGVIYIDDIATLKILSGKRLVLTFLNIKKEEDFFFLGDFKLEYE